LRARIYRASNRKPQQLRRFAVDRVATDTGYTRKQANKEWFEEECATVNEEKNATRERAIQIKTRQAKNANKLARTKERRLFRKKAKQLDEESLIEIERHRSIQDSCKFYKRLNDVRRPFEPQVVMCRAKDGELLTEKNQVMARWKENFEELLNQGFESEQPTRPFNLRDDGVDIDFPSHTTRQPARILSRPSCCKTVDLIWWMHYMQ
jgi:hypothetical protein